MSDSPGTVRLHRVLCAPPERVYRAFLDPDALSKWLPPHGFVGKVHAMDGRVGGGYRMSFTHFASGAVHSFSAVFTELVPGQLVRHSDRFDSPDLPGEMQVTVTLKSVACGTDLQIVQEGIPAAIPVESCYLGWQASLGLLVNVVEPEFGDDE